MSSDLSWWKSRQPPLTKIKEGTVEKKEMKELAVRMCMEATGMSREKAMEDVERRCEIMHALKKLADLATGGKHMMEVDNTPIGRMDATLAMFPQVILNTLETGDFTFTDVIFRVLSLAMSTTGAGSVFPVGNRKN